MAARSMAPRVLALVSRRKGSASRIGGASPATSSRNGVLSRIGASPASSSAPGLSVDNLKEADDAVDAIVKEAQSEDESKRSAEEMEAALRQLGLKWGLDKVVDPWNHGCFEGSALSGRLKEVLGRELSLKDLSFGLFTHPAGRVEVGDIRILKGPEAPHPTATTSPRFYAVRTPFRFHASDADSTAHPMPHSGVNTVLGSYELDEDGRTMHVSFNRVELALETNGLWTVETRHLPKPAPADLAVLLQTPDRTVTFSNTKSLAVLRRTAPPEPSMATNKQNTISCSAPPHPLSSTTARLEAILAEGRCSRVDALALYRECMPVGHVADVLGLWRGLELPTGSPMDGRLTRAGWWGKRFSNAENVDPLLFSVGGGEPFALDSRGASLAMVASSLGPAAPLARALLPLLRTFKPAARLRRMEDRKGGLTVVMMYDVLPITDTMRWAGPDTLLGVMDMRGMPPYFFVLRRERG